MIKHIWFDFSETIAFLKRKEHNRLRYESYAEVLNKKVNEKIINEYEKLYRKYDHSNAAIFCSLDLPPSYWSEKVNSVDPNKLYKLADPSIPKVLKQIKQKVPISLFSNIQTEKILPRLKINPEIFTHIINAKVLKHPKPALEGFYKMIELSNLPASEILYIGDDVKKDVLPAKEVGIKAGIIWKSSKWADYSFEKFEDILKII